MNYTVELLVSAGAEKCLSEVRALKLPMKVDGDKTGDDVRFVFETNDLTSVQNLRSRHRYFTSLKVTNNTNQPETLKRVETSEGKVAVNLQEAHPEQTPELPANPTETAENH